MASVAALGCARGAFHVLERPPLISAQLRSWVFDASWWGARADGADNRGRIVKPRRGGRAQLVDDVAALFGRRCCARWSFGLASLRAKAKTNEPLVISRPRSCRCVSSLRSRTSRPNTTTGLRPSRSNVTIGASAEVADAWRVERGFLRALPDPLPNVDVDAEARVMKDGFVRVRDVDYWAPPGASGRRVQVRCSLTEVVVHLEGELIAAHRARLRARRRRARSRACTGTTPPPRRQIMPRGRRRYRRGSGPLPLRRRGGTPVTRTGSEIAFLARALKAPRIAERASPARQSVPSTRAGTTRPTSRRCSPKKSPPAKPTAVSTE